MGVKFVLPQTAIKVVTVPNQCLYRKGRLVRCNENKKLLCFVKCSLTNLKNNNRNDSKIVKTTKGSGASYHKNIGQGHLQYNKGF